MHNVFKSKEGMYYHILLVRLEVDYDVVLAGGGNGGGGTTTNSAVTGMRYQ